MNNHLWWQKGIIYHIYPRSFQDADGDGVGDLEGIRRRLDYLDWLGVDALWLSPIYPSPMADFGYDVSNYTGIDPLFGTMEEFDALLEEAHARSLKIILDLVPNHTSDQHPWFKEARSSRDNPKRDWYIWKDPGPEGGLPNNWLSVFGGPAWTFDEKTGQYYYHGFLKEQPDLNWRNPDVQEAMLDVMRFWFDKGVDGFRIDVLWHLIKDDQFRDNPRNPEYDPADAPYNALLPVYSTDQPEVHDIVEKMRAVADTYEDRLLIGEIYLPIHKLVVYYGEEDGGVHLPFNFHLISLPWRAADIDAAISEYEGALPDDGWPNWVLGNHDQPRVASRIGLEQARVAAMLLLTLRGTPTFYYGDEIGMTDVDIPEDRVQDPQAKNLGRRLGRDPQRTPMQWDASEHAGFSAREPWLPVADDFRTNNVAALRRDPTSILTLHHRLIQLRRDEPALAVGSYDPVEVGSEVLAYMRSQGDRRWLVLLNLSRETTTTALRGRSGTVRLSTHLDREGDRVTDVAGLRPNEGIVVLVE